MGLKKYFSKRNLKKSPEPPGSSKNASEALHFCIQKHAARHLHYDFRLEYRGVLLSWAVPKGPSLNPQDKRLAVKVEDHPLDYQYFEGTIPKGHYGAGTVEIWDKGFYTVPFSTSRKEIEKAITEGLKKGHFAIVLDGERLRGEFIFQKLKKDPDDNAWLLIKKADSSANRRKTISTGKPSKKSKMPSFISPMLATLINQPFNDVDWLFEIKWDGYRALAFIDRGKVQLKSRAKTLFNQSFPEIVEDLKKINNQVILDGELVVLDTQGKSHFQLIQNYKKEGKGALYYYVFDLLYKDGRDLRELTLIERKEILKKYLKELSLSRVRFSDHVFEKGKSFFKEVAKKHLEGMVGKKIGSTYQSKRSHDWVKIKTTLRQEVVIGGFTAPRGSRQKFGALLVGVYDDRDKLIYIGHVGGGFDESLLKEVYSQLQPLVQKKSPFEKEPKANASVTWVKPKLVCEVSFAEWTKGGIMRQPIFLGLRSDKSSKSVKKESPEPSPEISSANKSKKLNKLTLTNLDKMYWPKEKFTKGDLLEYYKSTSSFILPYLKDRPIVLHRYPEGIEKQGFYQKELSPHPEWIKTYSIKHEGRVINYLAINDLNSLLYAINLGSIDLHPFISRYKKLDNPDYCIIDLDPHGISFKKVIEAALVTHEILQEIKVKHYCKTSGGKGLHIVIPLHGKYSFEQSKQFAEIICLYVHKKLPRFTSVERSPEKRPKKIYLDYLQNRFGQTVVAPYAVRPRAGALVSTPLLWEEVNDNLDPSEFNIKTVPKRLKMKGDIFKDILGAGIDLKKVIRKLAPDHKKDD